MIPPLTMIIDTREPTHTAYDFAPLGVPSIRRKLDTGDYGIKGYPLWSVERKNLNDAANTFLTKAGRKRFVKELERARSLEYFAILIEANVRDILAYKPYNVKGLSPAQIDARGKQILHSCLGWQIDYGIFVLFVDKDRDLCRAMVVRLAQRYVKRKNMEALGVVKPSERRKARALDVGAGEQETMFGGAA